MEAGASWGSRIIMEEVLEEKQVLPTNVGGSKM